MFQVHAKLLAVGIFSVLGFALALSPPVVGQDPNSSGPDAVNPFVVPDGSVDELMQFIDKLQNYEPATIEEYLNYREKAPSLLKEAASRILDMEKDKSSDAYKLATRIVLTVKVQGIGQQEPQVQQATVKELEAHVSSKKALEVEDLQLAYTLCQTLEMSGSQELAGEAYRKFGELIAKSDNDDFAEVGRQLLASARRLNLAGQEMLVQGRTLQGEKFDLASWKGKVVLVDFWATWCGPCVAEIPNVKRLYDEYHPRGFEVVGISLDEDRVALEAFVSDQQIPWAILHDDSPEGHPAARFYGIGPIPAMFLVGRDGKVISINALGPELDRLLKEQFAAGQAG